MSSAINLPKVTQLTINFWLQVSSSLNRDVIYWKKKKIQKKILCGKIFDAQNNCLYNFFWRVHIKEILVPFYLAKIYPVQV